jgi:hypothetical protein
MQVSVLRQPSHIFSTLTINLFIIWIFLYVNITHCFVFFI